MATKRENLEDPNSCLNKAGDDEPIFVLRAKDLKAPDTIRHWAMLAAGTGYCRAEKIHEAYKVAEAMEKWQGPKNFPT